jgi:putative membrane protein
MNPNGPWTGPSAVPAPEFVHHDAWWAGPAHLLPLLLLAVLIIVLVWGVLRLTSQGALTIAGVGGSAGPQPGAPPRDQALDELRVRYARGEVDRTDYLERSADLGGSPIPDAPADRTPPGESPADQATDDGGA